MTTVQKRTSVNGDVPPGEFDVLVCRVDEMVGGMVLFFNPDVIHVPKSMTWRGGVSLKHSRAFLLSSFMYRLATLGDTGEPKLP